MKTTCRPRPLRRRSRQRRAYRRHRRGHRPDFVDHDPAPDQGPGPEGFKAFWTAFRDAFPDLQETVVHLTADQDSIAIAYRAQGTHQGPFEGVEPTGRRIDIRGVQVTRFANGRMAERWGSSDQLTLLNQIKAAPAA